MAALCAGDAGAGVGIDRIDGWFETFEWPTGRGDPR